VNVASRRDDTHARGKRHVSQLGPDAETIVLIVRSVQLYEGSGND